MNQLSVLTVIIHDGLLMSRQLSCGSAVSQMVQFSLVTFVDLLFVFIQIPDNLGRSITLRHMFLGIWHIVVCMQIWYFEPFKPVKSIIHFATIFYPYAFNNRKSVSNGYCKYKNPAPGKLHKFSLSVILCLLINRTNYYYKAFSSNYKKNLFTCSSFYHSRVN